jgi:hypothetical protein
MHFWMCHLCPPPSLLPLHCLTCSTWPTQKTRQSLLYYWFPKCNNWKLKSCQGVRSESVRRRGISSFSIVSSGCFTCADIDKRLGMLVIGSPTYKPPTQIQHAHSIRITRQSDLAEFIWTIFPNEDTTRATFQFQLLACICLILILYIL